jgi:hypothetical protein
MGLECVWKESEWSDVLGGIGWYEVYGCRGWTRQGKDIWRLEAGGWSMREGRGDERADQG